MATSHSSPKVRQAAIISFMCLILFAWQAHPRYTLVVAANRDEFHSRPSAPAGFWRDSSQLLAGRDLQAGGTWLGITRSGRFAAITNYREPMTGDEPAELSRGHLVRDFLQARNAPLDHARRLEAGSDRYAGFNLLLGDTDELVYLSNRGAEPHPVPAGVHGLSNHLLDTDWPKVHHGCARLDDLLERDVLDPEAVLDLLADRRVIGGEEPPDFDLKLVPELLTRMTFIRSPVYGTRSSTVLMVEGDGQVTFVERQFDTSGDQAGTSRHEFRIGISGQ